MKSKLAKAKANGSSEPDMIRTSTDYDRFIPHGLQRVIKAGHVKKIMGSMKQYGFLPSHPIACFRDGEKFRMIDGHHRHAAAKSLGIPLSYVLLAKEFEAAVGDANTGKAWTCIEWARKHTLEGKKHYLTLNRYVVAGIPLLQAAAMLAGNSAVTGNVARQLISGEFVVKTTEQIDTILNFVRDFREISPAVASRTFIQALSMCYLLEGFSVSQLRDRLNANPRALVKSATTQQALEQIEEIYNSRSRAKVNIAFLAREAAANRSATNKAKEAA